MNTPLKEKIQGRIDEIDQLMRQNFHLEKPTTVLEKLESVTKFWSYLSDDERDYLNSVRIAIRESKAWGVV